ncbi:unnamed protein product, partial [Ectocarpus fasciculatus]
RGYGEGEQAYISYGLKSNDELLQFYGFVEADCPADTYVLDDIAKSLGVSGAKGGSPTKEVVIRRGAEVVSAETLEDLRALLGAAEGAGGGDMAVWTALRTVCEAELSQVRPDALGTTGDEGGSVRDRLALAFRREKASVLDEAIRNLEKLEQGAS